MSIRELARRVGKSAPAVLKWLRHPRWPFARKGPWDAETVERIRAWAATELSPDLARSPGETAVAAPVLTRRQVRRLRALLRGFGDTLPEWFTAEHRAEVDAKLRAICDDFGRGGDGKPDFGGAS